jgi:hypothetical protein
MGEIKTTVTLQITDNVGDMLSVSKVPGMDYQLTVREQGRRESVVNLSDDARRALILALGGIVNYGSERA